MIVRSNHSLGLKLVGQPLNHVTVLSVYHLIGCQSNVACVTGDSHRCYLVLLRRKHHVQELRVGQALRFVGHEELARCHAPVSNEDRELVLQNLRIIAHDDNMEAIVDVAASGFRSGVVSLYDFD